VSRPISIAVAARSLGRAWETRDLVTANDSVLRIVRIEGDYGWHRHDEDQLFVCWEGTFTFEQEGADTIILEAGDIVVVPGRTPHRISTDTVAFALMSIGRHTVAPA